MELELFLQKTIADKYLHACWLNSLSYLEYRGFRKIVRSQSTEEITKEILLHVNEEVKHALILKKLAIKIGGINFSHYSEKTMLSGQNLKKYFYNLDLEISKHASSNLYQAVTLTIELRALKIYRAYETLLQASQEGITIQVIIDDEEKHLDQFLNFLPTDEEDKFRRIEEKCFNELWECIVL